ncbi:hypothetical protein [Pedobacter sp. NJ-S-72]
MKNFIITCTILLTSTVLYSCSHDNGSKKTIEKPTSTTCYMAMDGKDTARMNLNYFGKKIKGTLVVNYDKKDNNHGEFEGAFKGDTLFVIYNFKIGKGSIGYRNPLAFLKKDGKLIMGIGKMANAMGRTYFDKDVPLDFGQGRFTYVPVACRKELK